MVLPTEHLEAAARVVSRLCGWVYFAAWSLSFYPQPLLNWRRGSTAGTTVDYPAINILGFACYTISCACFLYAPLIRAQYAARHPRAPEPTVRTNDLVFASHAFVLTVITYSQFYPRLWRLHVSTPSGTSKPIAGIFWGGIASVLVVLVIVVTRSGQPGHDVPGWAWIDAIYTLGFVKIIVTLCKYTPQAILNYRRKSTKGWSIHQVLLDLTGGVLSLTQLIIDSSLQADWSGLTGNPVKLGLSNISMFFDVLFIVQHFGLYRSHLDKQQTEDPAHERTPLVTENG